MLTFRISNNIVMPNKSNAVPLGTYDFQNRENYDFGRYGYGKNHVKLLHVRRDGPIHTIREYEVNY